MRQAATIPKATETTAIATAASPAIAAAAWHVYMIATQAGTLYTGITTDLARRLQEHRSGSRGARYFKMSAATRIVYCEQQPSRSDALRREAAIKRMTRSEKLALIAAAGTAATVTA